MSDTARFGVNPPHRCGFLLDASRSNYCRRLAAYARDLPGAPVPLALCAQHATAGDRELRPDEPYRRVSVTFEAVFCGVTPNRFSSVDEAVDLVRELIASEGGIASLLTPSSTIGRPAGQDAAPVVGRGGEGG